MIDFLRDPAWITTAATAIASICAAVASTALAIRNARKTAQIEKILQEAEERRTYLVCPHCGKKVHAPFIFRLPDGALDLNLDGVPDSVGE